MIFISEKNLPYISIIIPVFNGEKFIDSCIESIIGLNYPKDRFELIIIDNGSTDKTIEKIRNFQKEIEEIDLELDLKLYFEKIKSSYVARNLGIKNVKGEIIAFTDIDCIVDKDWLINIIKYFSDKNVGGVAGEILPDEGKDSIVERYSINEEIVSQKRTFNSKFLPYAQTANAAYRKDLFDKIGYFDDVISGGDADYSWRMQLKTDYKMVYAQDAVVLHRHRTDLKGLFKQRFKHGYGYVLVRNKYKDFQNKTPDSKGSSDRLIRLKTTLKKEGNLMLLPIMVNTVGFNLGKLYARFLLRINRI